MFKKLAIVGALVVTNISYSFAQTLTVGGKSDKELALEKERNKEVDCKGWLDKASEAKAKFLSTCKTSGAGKDIKSCSDILDDCEDLAGASSADSVDFPSSIIKAAGVALPNMDAGGGGGSGGNACSPYSYTDYKSELRDLKQSKKDAEKEIKDLQEKKSDALEKFADKKKSIMEAYQANQKEYNDDVYKSKEEERSLEKAKKDAEDKYQEQISSLQTQILTETNNRAAMVLTQGPAIAQAYRKAVEACETETLKYAAEVRSKTASSLGKTGNRIQEKYKACVKDAIEARKGQEEAYRLKMVSYDQQIQSLNQRLAAAQSSLQLLDKQSKQAAADRAQKAQDDTNNFMQKQQLKSSEMTDLANQLQTKSTDLTKAMNDAEVARKQAEAEVTDFQKQKPASKGSKVAVETMAEAQQQWISLKNCTNICSGTKYSRQCEDLDKTASKGSSSSKDAKSTK